MLRILSLQKNKIYLESKGEFSIPTDLINQYDLRKREGITLEEYHELMEKLILSASYYYLARRDYSKKELSDKLYQRYREKKIIEKIIVFLEEKGYIDDYEFARTYAENSRDGIKKIEYNLMLKGISSSVIKELLQSKDQEEAIIKAWEKLGSKEPEKKIASLMRKGFRYSDIKKAISEI